MFNLFSALNSLQVTSDMYFQIFQDRPEGGVNHEKAPFAKSCNPIKKLDEIIDFVKPTALIGA